ncbi:MmpS family transport accessory protein [Streptomyces albipurpureus]|uniref:MmpS family transport accessory protein n=1 Tax=Streptomyces albipurpureus TaxID=2897419 RepID=A0ABT0UQ35_9ACTN|nr:MmpS family transport accessory protein [Streptomyces sp. CWNU-1]MCM2390540.1 MmpS family transport accessory protein [Streptomyces sp. CWNU-1]
MHRSIRTAAVAGMAAIGLVFGLSACSEVSEVAKDEAVDQVDKAMNEKYEVTYEVTGKGVDSIQFSAGGGTATNPKLEAVDKPTLPWKKTVTLRGIMAPSVLPVAVDVSGDAQINCKIIYKGKTIADQSAKGLAAAKGCVAISPLAQ